MDEGGLGSDTASRSIAEASWVLPGFLPLHLVAEWAAYGGGGGRLAN